MNEEVWTNIATAIQKMTEIAAQLERRHDEIGTRIDRIVAAVENDQPTAARLAELEQENAELKQRLAAASPANAGTDPTTRAATRKTLPPLVTTLLAKNGVETDASVETAALDAALVSLPVEQRIAVKSQMARAGLIG
jgi:hypothetical protein